MHPERMPKARDGIMFEDPEFLPKSIPEKPESLNTLEKRVARLSELLEAAKDLVNRQADKIGEYSGVVRYSKGGKSQKATLKAKLETAGSEMEKAENAVDILEDDLRKARAALTARKIRLEKEQIVVEIRELCDRLIEL